MVPLEKKYQPNKSHSTAFKKSALTIAVIACVSHASAQSNNEGREAAILEEVVVTGVRQNLQNAQDIKRDADTFVDAISAEDMGSLPDRSVLEAMQRLPGVSIERFAAADDPDHFSVEGSGAMIRGMSATRSEFNGRDSFSANSGRGLSFQDVPPELMSSVAIYKNQSADMIEGGIGGTVSLRTRKPFDQPNRVLALSAEGTRGDLAEEWTPTLSGLFSDRWETDIGEFGFLINASHSKLVGVSHGIQSDVYKSYPAAEIAGAESFVGTDDTGIVWMPQGSNLTMKEDNRERQGLATSFQWQDNDGKYLFTAEYIRSKAMLEWWENALKYQGGYTATDLNTRPYGDTAFAFNEDGLFQSGFMSHGNNAWRANDNIGPDEAELNTRIPNPYSGMPMAAGEIGGVPEFGHKFQVDTRGSYTESLVEDMSLNFRWTPNDTWTVDLDYQHIEAENKVNDTNIMLGLAALQKYDITGSTPRLELIEPWNGQRDNNPDAYNNGVVRPGWTNDPQGDTNYFQDETSYWYRSAQDHFDRSEGTSDALRLDMKYAMEDSIITDVKAGVRWAEREQTIRNTGWGNWGSIAPEYSAGTLFLDHVPEQSDWYSLVDWSDFHRGDALAIQGGNSLYHVDRDVVAYHRDNKVCEGDGIQYSEGGSWIPFRCRDNVDSTYGIFSPDQISNTVETNQAAYARLDFAFDDLPMRVAGNVGLRYVSLERKATGYVQAPGLDDDFTENEQLPSGLMAPLTGESVLQYAQQQVTDGAYTDLDAFYNASENNWVGEEFWYLSDEERAFAIQGSGVQTATTRYDTWLPSLNLKLEITDNLLARFAASKAIAMPDMGDVTNDIDANAEVTTIRGEPQDPDNASDWESAIQTARITDLRGSAGNPRLLPMESTQYDASLEWYFAPTGSLTGTVFYKDLSNFFVQGGSLVPVTHPATGRTELVDLKATRNGGEGEMYGLEIAHQQFFDNLPEPLDGLGIQANYTYIEASGVPNNEESYDDAEWAGGYSDTGARVNLATVPLQGQSKHTANLVLMYEKYDWSARLAYNWRSKYLLTTRDVISKYPLWNDDAGFMDASLFYNVSDAITVGVQATNLLDTQSETLMIVDNQGTQAGRSWFVQDRRVSLIARAQF